MAEQKKQQMRISDAELEILKSTFADRDELLKTIRNLFFGLEMAVEEKKQIRDTFSGEQIRTVMRKQFLPEIQRDIPIGQCIDLWMTIDIKNVDEDEKLRIIQARAILIDLIEKALKLLENPDGEVVNLNSWMNEPKENWFTSHFIARNTFTSHIDQQLMVIKTLAGLKTETVEETKSRLMKDSNK